MLEELYVVKIMSEMHPIGWGCWCVLLLVVIGFNCKVYVQNRTKQNWKNVFDYAKENREYLLISILILYVALVLSVTLIARQPGEVRKYHLIPFWSWPQAVKEVVENGAWGMPKQIVYNLIAFSPIGFLLYFIHRITVKRAFLYGFLFSACIEIFQLIFVLGDFEWDDMLHNAIGCAVGVWIAGKVKQRMLKSVIIENNSIDKTSKKV